MAAKRYFAERKERLRIFFSSSKGKDILLYLLFVVVAFVFWSILTLNNLVQENYQVRFRIVNVPKNATIISDYPEELSVTVRSSGYTMLRYMFGKVPEVVADYKKFANKKSEILINSQDLGELIVAQFGEGASLVAYSPEAISIKYTTLPGKKVPIGLIGDYASNFQFVVNGKVTIAPDSLTIYSDASHLDSVTRVFTERLIKHNLTDSLYTKVAVQKIRDVKIVPDSVEVMIPVEPLVTKRMNLSISIRNLPENIKLVTFPSTVPVACLLPMSMYDDLPEKDMEVYVDYDDIKRMPSKLPVRIGFVPSIYRNVQLVEDSVEYIIEH